MCDPKPGARCSADTWKELSDARAKLDRSQRALDRRPEDPELIRRHLAATDVVERKQSAYDSSPRGQRDLATAIAEAPAASDSDSLRTRLAVGRRTRLDQKRALVRSQQGSTSAEDLAVVITLNRLRHPTSADLPPGVSRLEVGFFVPSSNTQPPVLEHFATAEAARDAAARRGELTFFDAQLNQYVPVDIQEQR